MRALFVALFSLFTVVGCAAAAPTGPQPPLPTSSLTIDTARGPVHFTVEVAADSTSRERGLMFRRHLGPNAGMLFDFHRPVMVSFWMKNTILPLDMLFIRADGTISTIHANAVPYSETPIPAAEPIRAVLEINGGRARALDIEPGDLVHDQIFGNAMSGRRATPGR